MISHLIKRALSIVALATIIVSAVYAQSDLAPLKVTTNVAPSPGFLYLAPNSRVAPRPYQSYLGIYNVNGGVVKTNRTVNYPFEFKVLPDGRLAFSELIVFAGASAAAGIFIVDTTLTVVDSMSQKRGYLATQHDFHVLPNGHRVILGAEDVTLDLSNTVPNGNPAANVVQAVVQEIDIYGNVLMQWKSLDHIPVTDSYEDLTAPAIRYIHNNALWIDDDGNWLLSMRHQSAVFKVNRRTGEIMWILGGKRNQFTFIGEHEESAPTYFSYQHDIRRLPNGHITMFDNGTQHVPQYSRGVEYEIDEVNKTCKLVWEYRHSPNIYVGIQGGMQTLPNGHRLFGWGSAANEGAPGVTEVDSTGTVVFEASYPKQMFVYRATKHPFWPPGRASASITVDDVSEGGTYRYANAKQDAGLRIRFTKLTSFFYNRTLARRFMWSPSNPRWLGEAPDARQVRIDVHLEGISEHELELRFNVDTLGVAKDAEAIVVYRRDAPEAPETVGGTFTALPTRYDATTRELVVSNTHAGEFTFGIPAQLPGSLPITPKLLSPINGDLVLELVVNVLRVTIPGRADSLRIQVYNDAAMTSIVADSQNASDRMYVATPASERVLYWRAQTTLDGRRSEWSSVDSFTVSSPFVSVERPDANATWSLDSGYVITWTTNLTGRVRIDLVRGNAQPHILIRDSVRVEARGFLWRLPLDVPSGDDYHVRITSLDAQFAGVEHTGTATITVNGVSSVSEYIHNASISVYPQPAAEHVTLTMAETSIARVRIFNVVGEQQLVQGANANTIVVDVRALNTGVSTLAIEDVLGRVFIRTIVVQH
ncbi:MAG: aryl-sulfate sulfotransferase [bacterium]|nr:aryl-sulfate sulfotransferase [bacterium]